MLRALRFLPLRARRARLRERECRRWHQSARLRRGGALCTETVDPIGYNGAYTGTTNPRFSSIRMRTDQAIT